LPVANRASAAASGELDDLYAKLRSDTVAELETFADWCTTTKLFADRDEVLEAILHFDPSNEAAHRALKHTRQRDGSWTPPAKRTESRNYGKAFEKECAEKRDALVKSFVDSGLALLDAHVAKSPTERSRWKATLYADALAIDSDSELARALGGEARRDQEWVLLESVVAKARRLELDNLVREIVAAVPSPTDTAVREDEGRLGVDWSHAVATGRVRVLSNGSLDEARRMAVMCSAAIEMFGKVLDVEVQLPPDYTIYVLANPGSRDAFLGAWPGWSDEQRAQLKTWAGCGVPGDIHQARWDADEAHRLDGAVRHTLGLLMLRDLQFDHQKCAWAWEGVGIYLTRELVGTRYTWYSTAPASGDSETKDLLGRLMVADVNWINELYQRAKRGKAPSMAKLCAARIDAFGVDDVLASYALAAYLIEGRPTDLPKLMRSLSADGGLAALTALFDGDLSSGDARLVRWLSERR